MPQVFQSGKWSEIVYKMEFMSNIFVSIPIGMNVNKNETLFEKLKKFLNETDETNYNESPHANLFISIQLLFMFFGPISLLHIHIYQSYSAHFAQIISIAIDYMRYKTLTRVLSCITE